LLPEETSLIPAALHGHSEVKNVASEFPTPLRAFRRLVTAAAAPCGFVIRNHARKMTTAQVMTFLAFMISSRKPVCRSVNPA
jgi:hypothetical protein